ncbi:hypothetical protein V3C99_002657 [Haemonchus contortus]
MKNLLLFIACVISFKAYTCAPLSSLEEEICASEWVLHVRATGRVSQNSTGFHYILHPHLYGIEVIEVYRSPSNYTKLPNRVFTAPQSCGIELSNNTEYLLRGEGDGNGTLFTLCRMPRVWGTVSAAESESVELHMLMSLLFR